MDQERIPYMSFLLRLWLDDGGEYECPDRFPGEWRASLEDPHTQALQVFANLEALFAYLLRETSGWALGDGAHLQQEGSASQSPPVPNF